MHYKKVKIGDNMIRVNRVSNYYLMRILDREVLARRDVALQAFEVAKRRRLV